MIPWKPFILTLFLYGLGEAAKWCSPANCLKILHCSNWLQNGSFLILLMFACQYEVIDNCSARAGNVAFKYLLLFHVLVLKGQGNWATVAFCKNTHPLTALFLKPVNRKGCLAEVLDWVWIKWDLNYGTRAQQQLSPILWREGIYSALFLSDSSYCQEQHRAGVYTLHTDQACWCFVNILVCLG